MGRLLIPLALVALAFWVFSIVDCAIQPPTRHRGASKRVWILITLVPVIGGILWWVIGRSRDTQPQPAGGQPVAPDDAPRFTASDERIRRLEEELAMLDAEEAFGSPSVGDDEASDEGEADSDEDHGDGPRDERA